MKQSNDDDYPESLLLLSMTAASNYMKTGLKMLSACAPPEDPGKADSGNESGASCESPPRTLLVSMYHP